MKDGKMVLVAYHLLESSIDVYIKWLVNELMMTANEIVTICSTGLARKPIILEPQSRVCFLGVFWDVGWRSVPWREGGVEDVSVEGLRSQQVEARALILAAVIASATMRVVAVASLLPLITIGTPTDI